MFTESVVAVSAEPAVELFVAQPPGPAERTLLVIHGGPDWDHTYLREPLAELAGRHRVVLPDLRGCGRSTRGLGDDRYTPAAATADLVALLDALGTPQVDVLGFSYGGLIAQRLALAAPERVRRLIVASSSVLPVPPDAFDGWHEREERRAPEAAVWSDPSAVRPRTHSRGGGRRGGGERLAPGSAARLPGSPGRSSTSPRSGCAPGRSAPCPPPVTGTRPSGSPPSASLCSCSTAGRT